MNFSDDVLKLNPELSQAQRVEYRAKPERLLIAGDGFDSDLERDFALELTARGLVHIAHPFTFHLPGGVDYTPDFIAWHSRTDENGQIFRGAVTIYEVKGEYVKNTRDSRTRFKIAAGLYPFTFVWVTLTRAGEWRETNFKHPAWPGGPDDSYSKGTQNGRPQSNRTAQHRETIALNPPALPSVPGHQTRRRRD